MNNLFGPTTVIACAAYGLNVLVMVTVVALTALIAVRSTLRRDASARYSLCLVALICILLSPLVVFLLNHYNFGLIFLELPGTGQLPFLPVVATTTNAPPLAHNPLGWGVFPLLLSLWGVGAIGGVVRFLYGWRRAMRLRRTARPVDAPVLDSVREIVQHSLGASLPPILSSEYAVTPVAIGLLDAAVILPEGLAEALTPLQLRHVLLHECAHIAFRHAFGGVVQCLVGLLYWPHPLVTVLCRELAQAREEICDNVASQESGATCYARTLLAIAQGFSVASPHASALALLGPETSLEKRINGLLDPRRNRMVGMKRGKIWAVTGVITVTMTLAAAVRVVADNTNGRTQLNQKQVMPAKPSSDQAVAIEARVVTDVKKGQSQTEHKYLMLAKPSSDQRYGVFFDGKHTTSTSKKSPYLVFRVVPDGKHGGSASKNSPNLVFLTIRDGKHGGSAGN